MTPFVDLTNDGEEIIIAKGGNGGKGNTLFNIHEVQTPRKATPGKIGNELN